MIKLINNEFKKIGIIKLLSSLLIFLIIIIIIFEFIDDMKNTIFNLIPFSGIMISILFSGIISNEIENGTFRFYLTKPISRYKIYKSKFITMIIYTIFLQLFIFFVYCILCHQFDKTYLIKYVKYSSPLILMCGLIILLSTIFRNTSITVGLSVLIIAFSLLITQLLLDIDFTIVEFTFLPYLDFTLFNDSEGVKAMNELYKINLNQNKGIIINLVYSFIFFKLGNIIFNKKDIKN